MKKSQYIAVDMGAFLRPRKIQYEGMEFMGSPMIGDVPMGFTVETDTDTREFSLRYHYLSAVDEPVTALQVNNVCVEVGRNSLRIFTITVGDIDVRTAPTADEAARILRNLLQVFVELLKSTKRPGTQISYEAARDGATRSRLPAASQSTPPPWLIDAVTTLRENRHSVP